MEVAAKKFEREDRILEEINQQSKDNLFHRVEDDGYFPYCTINFKSIPKLSDTTQNQSLELDDVSCSASMLNSGTTSLNSEVLGASTSCTMSTLHSRPEPLESSIAPSNVRCLSLLIALEFIIAWVTWSTIVYEILIRGTTFCLTYFAIQVHGNTSSNVRNLDSRKFSEDFSWSALESTLSSHSCDEYLSVNQVNSHEKVVKPALDQDSDGSDSEIFRVKRRSTQKVDKKNMIDSMTLKHSDHQVFSRVPL